MNGYPVSFCKHKNIIYDPEVNIRYCRDCGKGFLKKEGED